MPVANQTEDLWKSRGLAWHVSVPAAFGAGYPDGPPLAKRFTPEVAGIFETCAWLESKGVENTRPMNKGGSQKAGDVTLTMTHAVHSCGILDDGKMTRYLDDPNVSPRARVGEHFRRRSRQRF